MQICASVLLLTGCADPHFIHDPQIGFFTREQLPYLLKSLRCEIATYVAANNQRKIINTAIFKTDPVTANREYPFFELDASRFGGISLELKIQDTAGTQSGTSADWKRTANALHTNVWHIAPTLGEQNSYDILTGFLLPQDIYGLDDSNRARKASETDELITNQDQPFLCYKQIPRYPGKIFDTSVYNEIFTEQDLESLAKGEGGEPQFNRVRVNAGLPLAAWLLDVGRTVSSTSLVSAPNQDNEEIIAGQMTYSFVIQTTAGLDVRNTISSSLWTGVGLELNGSFQHTGTLTLVLNGQDSVLTSGVKAGNATRVLQIPIKQTTKNKNLYCPVPVIGGGQGPGFQRGNYCYWPPRPPQLVEVRTPRKPREEAAKPKEGDLKIQEFPLQDGRPTEPAQPAKPRFKLAPFSRPFQDKPRGSIEYPSPLTPLGQ